MTKEKKYFIAGTDEEVLLGDVISTTLEKKFKDGTVLTRDIEFTVDEENIPYALDLGILSTEPCKEEKEEEEEESEYSFCNLGEAVDKLEDRVCALEEAVAELIDKDEEK